jgi:hypothetical protein
MLACGRRTSIPELRAKPAVEKKDGSDYEVEPEDDDADGDMGISSKVDVKLRNIHAFVSVLLIYFVSQYCLFI